MTELRSFLSPAWYNPSTLTCYKWTNVPLGHHILLDTVLYKTEFIKWAKRALYGRNEVKMNDDGITLW